MSIHDSFQGMPVRVTTSVHSGEYEDSNPTYLIYDTYIVGSDDKYLYLGTHDEDGDRIIERAINHTFVASVDLLVPDFSQDTTKTDKNEMNYLYGMESK